MQKCDFLNAKFFSRVEKKTKHNNMKKFADTKLGTAAIRLGYEKVLFSTGFDDILTTKEALMDRGMLSCKELSNILLEIVIGNIEKKSLDDMSDIFIMCPDVINYVTNNNTYSCYSQEFIERCYRIANKWNVQAKEKRHVLFVCNINDVHWALYVFSPQRGEKYYYVPTCTVNVYDSMSNLSTAEFKDNMCNSICEFMYHTFGYISCGRKFQYNTVPQQQPGELSCGLFVIRYILRIMEIGKKDRNAMFHGNEDNNEVGKTTPNFDDITSYKVEALRSALIYYCRVNST